MFYCRQGIIGLFFIFSDLIISLSPGLKSEVRKYWNTKKFCGQVTKKKNFTRPVTQKQNIF